MAAHKLQAIEPIHRSAPPSLRLGLAAYGFRSFFKDSNRGRKPDVAPDKAITMFDFVDYCAQQSCPGAELTSYFFPENVDRKMLLELRRHAFLKGVTITGTAVGNNFALPKGEALKEQIEYVKTWIDHAAAMGAPHIRVFAGAAAKGLDPEIARKNCIESLEECCAYAGEQGIFLGLENHGGIVAKPEQLLDIVQAVQSPWFGINLDTGNFRTEDPYTDLERCAPYAINVQVKVEMKPPKGGSQPADLPRLTRILRESGYQGWVILEYEAAEDPYKAVPEYLAQMKKLFL